MLEEFLAGNVTQAQLARRYDISPHLVIQWRQKYASGKLVEKHQHTAQDEQIKELERMVGRLTMEIELLKKAVKQVTGIIGSPGFPAQTFIPGRRPPAWASNGNNSYLSDRARISSISMGVPHI